MDFNSQHYVFPKCGTMPNRSSFPLGGIHVNIWRNTSNEIIIGFKTSDRQANKTDMFQEESVATAAIHHWQLRCTWVARNNHDATFVPTPYSGIRGTNSEVTSYHTSHLFIGNLLN
jgi:hypothetical protein